MQSSIVHARSAFDFAVLTFFDIKYDTDEPSGRLLCHL
jgi:hypothetical protein